MKILLFISSLFPLLSLSQLDSVNVEELQARTTPITRSTTTIKYLFNTGLYSEFTYGSNSLDNEFVNTLLIGGQLDSSKLTQISQDLDLENNFIAGEIKVAPQVFFRPDTLFGRTDIVCYVRVAYNQLSRFEFGKDVFDLAFFGNAPFEGGSAKLDMSFKREGYQKIEFGIDSKKKANRRYGVGLYFGHTYADVSLRNSSLYTASGGTHIDLGLRGSALFSDTANTGFFRTKGIGLGLNHIRTIAPAVSLMIEDFGFMLWNKNTGHSNIDTSYNYQGFSINDLTNNSLSFNNIEDTLGIESYTSTEARMLPFLIALRKHAIFKENKRVAPFYGITYRYKYNKIPEVYFGGTYRPSPATYVSLALGYGGYNGLHLNAGLQMKLTDYVHFNVNSRAIVNTINPNGLGKSVQIGLTWWH